MLSVMVLLSGGFVMLMRQSIRKAERRSQGGMETQADSAGPGCRDGAEGEERKG